MWNTILAYQHMHNGMPRGQEKKGRKNIYENKHQKLPKFDKGPLPTHSRSSIQFNWINSKRVTV